MSDRIEVYCDSQGVWYSSTRDRLIGAGIATADMFPDDDESWRGNGFFRQPGEPLWSVQKAAHGRYRVMWGTCVEAETEPDSD